MVSHSRSSDPPPRKRDSAEYIYRLTANRSVLTHVWASFYLSFISFSFSFCVGPIVLSSVFLKVIKIGADTVLFSVAAGSSNPQFVALKEFF